ADMVGRSPEAASMGSHGLAGAGLCGRLARDIGGAESLHRRLRALNACPPHALDKAEAQPIWLPTVNPIERQLPALCELDRQLDRRFLIAVLASLIEIEVDASLATELGLAHAARLPCHAQALANRPWNPMQHHCSLAPTARLDIVKASWRGMARKGET